MLFACLILAAELTQSSTPIDKKQQAPPKPRNTSAVESPTPSVVPLAAPPNAPSTANKETNPKEQPKWWPPPPLWDIYWPTVLLVIFGGFAAWVAVGTLKDIREQTEAIKESADATKRSVDAIMDADRALLLILWENFIHINPEARHSGVLSHCFNWHFQNTGKSPAFIQKVSSRFIVIRSLDDLPPEPAYLTPREVSYESEPLLPDKNFGPVYSPLESDLSFDEVEAEHRGKKCLLYAFGFVQYLDTYRRSHETRFGLVYDSAPTLKRDYDRFRLAGPPAYNRYT